MYLVCNMRYKINFSYDGTAFHGYQKQSDYRSVEECLENALYDINNHTFTSVTSAGRTDKGVHAKGQVASFNLDVDITEYKLKCALNSLLPDDIHVFSTEIVDIFPSEEEDLRLTGRLFSEIRDLISIYFDMMSMRTARMFLLQRCSR